MSPACGIFSDSTVFLCNLYIVYFFILLNTGNIKFDFQIIEVLVLLSAPVEKFSGLLYARLISYSPIFTNLNWRLVDYFGNFWNCLYYLSYLQTVIQEKAGGPATKHIKLLKLKIICKSSTMFCFVLNESLSGFVFINYFYGKSCF